MCPASSFPEFEDFRTEVLPPLENGDQLTLPEFERRSAYSPFFRKAELVEGVVFLTLDEDDDRHHRPQSDLQWWLSTYRVPTPYIETHEHATLRLDPLNQMQPDLLMRVPESAHGHCRMDDEGILEGPPEFVAEIASSSASLDLHAKLHAYCRNGVKEYMVWRVYEEELDWFVFRDEHYEPLLPDDYGVIKSETFPGLWLDIEGMMESDLNQVSTVLRRGLATLEYAIFAAQLC